MRAVERAVQEYERVTGCERRRPKIGRGEPPPQIRVTQFGEMQQAIQPVADQLESRGIYSAGIERNPQRQQGRHRDGCARLSGEADPQRSVLMPGVGVDRGRSLFSDPRILHPASGGVQAGCRHRREQFRGAGTSKIEQGGQYHGVGKPVEPAMTGTGIPDSIVSKQAAAALRRTASISPGKTPRKRRDAALVQFVPHQR